MNDKWISKAVKELIELTKIDKRPKTWLREDAECMFWKVINKHAQSACNQEPDGSWTIEQKLEFKNTDLKECEATIDMLCQQLADKKEIIRKLTE